MTRNHALLAIVLAGGIVLAVRAQSTPPPTASPWPPKPDQLVTIASSTASIPFGGSIVIYEVPWDRWFVLTDWWAGNSGNAIELMQESGGVLTVKLPTGTLDPTGFQGISIAPRVSGAGISFPPRSKVLLRNSGGAGPLPVPHSFLGYLAQP